jgi:hypothetical protein
VTLATIVPARDRCLPVDEAFAPLLPDAGLVRGRIVGCTGSAAMSLALALAARATTTGSWLAVVGVSMLGVEAVAELGVPLSRLVSIESDGRPATWAERVVAAADGFDLILTRPPAGAERVVRKVKQRLQARGVVLLAVGPSSPGVSCDVEFSTTAVTWAGLGDGHGSLLGRRATVRVGGRRVPRPIECEMWLPGPSGRVVARQDHEHTQVDTHVDALADRAAGSSDVHELSRAG